MILFAGQTPEYRRKSREDAPRPRVTIGVDLGKMSDFTAVVVGERLKRDDGKIHHTLRLIERLPLGTPYPAVADRVSQIVTNLKTRNGTRPDLVVDASGVGVAVVDLFRERGLRPVPVTIVAGVDLNEREDGSLTVGKGHLIGALEVLLQTARLHLPATEEADILEKELMDFRQKYTPSGNVTFDARSGQHDDLVLAAALAVAIDVPASPGSVVAWGKARRGY